VFDSPKRLDKIVDYIIAYHDQKTFNKAYSALFAVSSIDNVIKYYDLFQKKKEEGKQDLRIATIFTYGANEADADAQDYLPGDETEQELGMAAEPKVKYLSSHTRDKLEGFIGDYNQMYGTLYVDKNLRQHGLIQAFSRTNRILGEQKSQGNILSFRNLKKATDDAITLFSNNDAIETDLVPPYASIAEKVDEAIENLREVALT